MPSQIKSKQRVVDHGEVFTAEREVKAMCDLVADECNRIDSRFLEPSCGTGNFLVEILTRKLSNIQSDLDSVIAISSLYGIELLQDNTIECRDRLYNLWYKACGSDRCADCVKYILSKNIICGNALTRLTINNTPITFAEWTFDGTLVKRRDYTMQSMMESESQTPIREYEPIEYLRIPEQG